MKEPIINPIKLLMQYKADLFKSLQKEIFNAIPSECISTSADSSYTSNFTKEVMEEAIDKVLASKIDYKSCSSIEKGEIKVIDHEKIRENIPWYEWRGKTVLYNPEDEELIYKMKQHLRLKESEE